MSNWTHVAAIVRVDSFRIFSSDKLDFSKVFGKELNYDDMIDRVYYNEDEFLPIGSEGSLQMSVWTNPNTSSVAAYTVSIFGDLRDHNDPDAVIEWFKEKCQLLMIRQATIVVENEQNGHRTWTYFDE